MKEKKDWAAIEKAMREGRIVSVEPLYSEKDMEARAKRERERADAEREKEGRRS